jgi:pSer/pThr/pTyr-binding forkhead associated (FHA) protein
VATAPELELTVRGSVVRRLKIPPRGLSIGRGADNDLAIDDPALSRHHARVVRRGVVDELVDRGSRNGVHVNDRRVADRHRLSEGDVITIGVYSFRYRAGTVAGPEREVGVA